MSHLQVDAADLAGAASANLAAAADFSDVYRHWQSYLAVRAAAFGHTAASLRLGSACERAANEIGIVVGRLVAVLETDVDKLYQAAAGYAEAEEAAAAGLGRPQPVRQHLECCQ